MIFLINFLYDILQKCIVAFINFDSILVLFQNFLTRHTTRSSDDGNHTYGTLSLSFVLWIETKAVITACNPLGAGLLPARKKLLYTSCFHCIILPSDHGVHYSSSHSVSPGSAFCLYFFI